MTGDAILGHSALSMAGATGLEPATSAVTGQRSKPIELRPQLLGGLKNTTMQEICKKQYKRNNQKIKNL